MKKVVFFLALTLFSALSVTAQPRYTSAVMTNSYVSHPDKTPFDTWGNNYFVAYGRDTISPYNPVFYLVDISGYNNRHPRLSAVRSRFPHLPPPGCWTSRSTIFMWWMTMPFSAGMGR